MRTLELCLGSLVLSVLTLSITTAQQKKSAAKETAAPKTTANPLPTNGNRSSEGGAAAKLPVRQVVLYKTGVGYFEHIGHVHGDQNIRVDFTSSQLNDVLQSLTILDLNGGRIDGVNYNSEAPLSQRLGTLHLPLEERTDVSKFYGALRGARLTIRSGASAITGRLLIIERKTRVSGGTTLEVDLLTLVDDSGEVRSVELTPAVSVQLAEGEVAQEVSRYLHLLASARREDYRRMNIATAGSGDRQLYISYISEVPVWKTTYRIVLPAKASQQPLLQGWAIVDNTVGEDWNDVQLSLVAGAPHSFIEQLSQPYYARRPVIPLPEFAQLAPQTHESAMVGGISGLSGRITDSTGGAVRNVTVTLLTASGGKIESVTTDSQGWYSFGDIPAGTYKLTANITGFKTAQINDFALDGNRPATANLQLEPGSVTSTVEVRSSAVTVDTSTSEMIEVSGTVGSGRQLGGHSGGIYSGVYRRGAGGVGGGSGGGVFNAAVVAEARRGMEASAQGSDLGDFFQYKLKDRVTIHKNESALVPIVQAQVAAEKVSLWSASSGSARALHALWLTNSSPLTLDGGSFTVLEDEAFAGEGLTDTIKPGEKRLLSYALDLGVRVTRTANNTPQRVTRVHVEHGSMRQICETRADTAYLVRNDDTTPRTVLIEHPLRSDWNLSQDTPKPEEATSDAYRFRVNVDAKGNSFLVVHEAKPLETAYLLTSLTDDQITLFVKQKSINTQIESAFRKITGQKSQVASLEAEISRRDDEMQKIYDDQQRLRENLKALKGSTEERALTQRYTQQLADQETRLEALRRESKDLQMKHDQTQEELDKMMESLTFDVDL